MTATVETLVQWLLRPGLTTIEASAVLAGDDPGLHDANVQRYNDAGWRERESQGAWLAIQRLEDHWHAVTGGIGFITGDQLCDEITYHALPVPQHVMTAARQAKRRMIEEAVARAPGRQREAERQADRKLAEYAEHWRKHPLPGPPPRSLADWFAGPLDGAIIDAAAPDVAHDSTQPQPAHDEAPVEPTPEMIAELHARVDARKIRRGSPHTRRVVAETLFRIWYPGEPSRSTNAPWAEVVRRIEAGFRVEPDKVNEGHWLIYAPGDSDGLPTKLLRTSIVGTVRGLLAEISRRVAAPA